MSPTFHHICDFCYRQIPPWEVRAISKNLEDILQCRVSELPTETLVHVFWHMFVHFEHSLVPFIDCLKRPYVWPRAQCFPYIFHECPRRFLTNMEKQEKCFNILWDPEANAPRKNIQVSAAYCLTDAPASSEIYNTGKGT